MAMLMILCPVKKKPVATGMDMPIEQVRSGQIQLTNNTLANCPECGQNHTWSGKDVI
ncbi:MAG: hypothetical protein H0W90_02200 [Actinobacteria bacterium]|nr:hypothetical protein [Actinomycetota bacterium]